jgi:hypothetical protein
MASKELRAPSEVPMCEASILPYVSINPTAWNTNSTNFRFTESKKVARTSNEGDEAHEKGRAISPGPQSIAF